jgi:predicted secreted protein
MTVCPRTLLCRATLAGVLLFAAGHAPAAAANAPAVVTASDPSITATLAKGAYLIVALPANVTTGYDWEVRGATPPGVVLSLGKSYLRQTAASPAPGGALAGAGGTTLLLFAAQAPGTATLTFAYRRAWEKDAAPARTAVFHVVVK